jgi:hypothetical protein
MSLANAKPSLHAIASIVSRSEIPSITTAHAPKNTPVASWTTATTETTLKVSEIAASTLIFIVTTGGGI